MPFPVSARVKVLGPFSRFTFKLSNEFREMPPKGLTWLRSFIRYLEGRDRSAKIINPPRQPPPVRYSQRGWIADEHADWGRLGMPWYRNDALRSGMVLGMGSYINTIRFMLNPLRWARLVLVLLGRRGFPSNWRAIEVTVLGSD